MNYTQEKYNVYQSRMPLDLDISYEKNIGPECISKIVNEVVEGINVCKYVDFSNRNAYGYDGVMMLKLVILAVSLFGYASLRDLEDYTKHDIRFMFIAQGATPSHQSFKRFITDDLKYGVEEIFLEINKYIEKKVTVNTDVLYIDGSKFEANANKMTFVWRKATEKNRAKCWITVDKHIKELNEYLSLLDTTFHLREVEQPSFEYLMDICDQLENYCKKENIKFVTGKGKRKTVIQRHYDVLKDCAIRLYKYTAHMDILGERNSFSKTDPDATFMHMKYDYYNHTNVFKPGYNVQLGVSDNFIRNIYVSSDANDLNTYIPFMDNYYKAYHRYPLRTPADAGYGSYDNYYYCKLHGIKLSMKYSGIEAEKKKITEKNKYRKANFKKNEDGILECPDGYTFHLINTTIDSRSRYPRVNQMYSCEHCVKCRHKKKCTKSKTGRLIKGCEQLDTFRKEVKEYIEDKQGATDMIQRSIQSEGTFGQLKEDYKYAKLHRRSLSNVKLEIYLIAIGHNLRRFHNQLIQNHKPQTTSIN